MVVESEVRVGVRDFLEILSLLLAVFGFWMCFEILLLYRFAVVCFYSSFFQRLR